jgi:uncharacterized membrane protein YozB (DUF420 family)
MIAMLIIGLGHPIQLNTALNLATQIITVAILFLSLYYKNKKNYKTHAITMTIAVVVHLLTFILVMGPIFFEFLSFFQTETSLAYVQTTWIHAIPGAVALVLGIVLVLLWAFNSSNIENCFKRKRIMDITLILWIISLIFGIITYALIYF